jgi:hypothetical protein
VKLNITSDLSALTSEKKTLIQKAFAERVGKAYADVTDADIEDKLCQIICAWSAASEKEEAVSQLSITDLLA